MRTIKYNLATMAALAFVALAPVTTSLAQPGPRGGGMGLGSGVERRLEVMDETLDLTDAQRADVSALLDSHRQAALAWFDANPNATRDERAAFHTQHRASLRAAMVEILSDEQEAKLDQVLPAAPFGRGAMRPDRRGRGSMGTGGRGAGRGAFGPGGGGGGRGAYGRGDLGAGVSAPGVNARVMARLDLTTEQREQLHALRSEHRQEVQEWIEANPDATAEERAAFLAQHRAEGRTELASILTDEQIEELDVLRSTWQDRAPRGRMGRGRGRG